MAIAVRQLHKLFVGEVSGVDLRQPPDAAMRAGIVAAADRHAVLVFRDQHITDQQHIAFSRTFGRLETTIKAYRPGFKGRLDPHVADISNLDEEGGVLAPDDRRRMNSLGNRLWHTDYTFKDTPGKYSLLSARVIPAEGGETQFADMRAAYDALPDAMKARIERLVAEHSLLYSRGTIGFTDFSAEERARLPSAPQVLVRVHPGSGRKTLYLASHAMLIHGRPHPAARPDGACDAAGVRVYTPLAGRRPGDVGQSLHHASRTRRRCATGARTASHHGDGRGVHASPSSSSPS